MLSAPVAVLFIAGTHGFTALGIYAGAIAVFLLSIFWRPEIGIYFLVPLLPLQTVRYLLHDLPFGEKLVDFLLLGVIAGLFIQRKGRVFPQTALNGFLIFWAVFNYLSLWQGSFFTHAGFPLWLGD